MLVAHVGWIINAVVLVIYLIFAEDSRAWPSEFFLWAWIPSAVFLVLRHFFDGVTNTTRNIARIYLLQRDGVNYDCSTMQQIWQSLIPKANLSLVILWKISGIVSFTCLLIFQGWATAICAHAAIVLFAELIPINYGRHLKRIQASIPQDLAGEQHRLLTDAGVSYTELGAIIDQAINEHRDPEQWGCEILGDTLLSKR